MTDAQTQFMERLLEGYGLVERSFKNCALMIPGMRIGQRSTLRVEYVSSDIEETLHFLSRFTVPATRHVLFPVKDKYSAIINNLRNGSDFADLVYHFSSTLKCRAARVMDQKSRIWKKAGMRGVSSYEARIVQLHGSDGEMTKSVICMNDGGRFVLQMSDPDDASRFIDANAKRKRDQFRSEHLQAFLQWNGFPQVNLQSVVEAGKYLLVHEQLSEKWAGDVEANSCSIEQRDDPAYMFYSAGLSYVDQMKTHASSVIALFEKAQLLNPEYEPLVRTYLKDARAMT